jgi:hypothetical protein
MIWVIGDIHGMADLLDQILAVIRRRDREYRENKTFEPCEKIIFLGDYIDRGPDSKKVLDTIMDLEFDKVCLAGNHEDLYNHYRLTDPENPKEKCQFITMWYDNNCSYTLRSIGDDPKYSEEVSSFFRFIYTHSRDSSKKPSPMDFEGMALPKKYDDFLLGLQYSHQEFFQCGGRKVRFAFFHSLPCWDQSLETQLNIKTARDLLNYLDTPAPHFEHCLSYCSPEAGRYPRDEYEFHFQYSKINLEFTFVWLRTYGLLWGYGTDVIVHGHTPAMLIRDGFIRQRNYPSLKHQLDCYPSDLAWPFLWTRADSAGYLLPDEPKNAGREPAALRNIEYSCGEGGAVEAINLDTGASSCRQALSAAGFSDETLSRGEIPVISAFSRENKLFGGLCCERLLKTSDFGRKTDDREPLWKMMAELQQNRKPNGDD